MMCIYETEFQVGHGMGYQKILAELGGPVSPRLLLLTLIGALKNPPVIAIGVEILGFE